MRLTRCVIIISRAEIPRDRRTQVDATRPHVFADDSKKCDTAIRQTMRCVIDSLITSKQPQTIEVVTRAAAEHQAVRFLRLTREELSAEMKRCEERIMGVTQHKSSPTQHKHTGKTNQIIDDVTRCSRLATRLSLAKQR